MKPDEYFEILIPRIIEERQRQNAKHGDVNDNKPVLDSHWIAVLAEETGESNQARDYIERNGGITTENLHLVETALEPEIIEVVASGIQWLQRLYAAKAKIM